MFRSMTCVVMCQFIAFYEGWTVLGGRAAAAWHGWVEVLAGQGPTREEEITPQA